MAYNEFNWSPAKIAVIGAVVVAIVLAFMIPITVMSMHYNSTEVDRATACIAEHGVYVDGVCSWSSK